MKCLSNAVKEDFVTPPFLPCLAEFLKNEKLHLVSPLLFSSCRVTNRSLLERRVPVPGDLRSVLLLAVPYDTQTDVRRNISRYAAAKDYHLYFSSLFDRLLPLLKQQFPQQYFYPFADHSPIDERATAVACGFGVFGDNGLLITRRYGSYVFLGEILSTLPPEGYLTRPFQAMPLTRTDCLHCGLCRQNCPMQTDGLDGCLSFLTQQKGELSEKTKASMRLRQTAWGCDICQDVCPLNQGVQATDVAFFREDLTPSLTADFVRSLSDEDFSSRAYAWKKRATILRNLAALEEDAPSPAAPLPKKEGNNDE